MAFSNTYVFGFAAGICLVCSLAVSSVSLSLRDRQDLNRERDLQSNILQALGLPEDGSELEGDAVTALWDARIKQVFVHPSGEIVDGVELDQDGDGDLDNDDFDLALKEVKGTEATPEVLSVYQRQDDGKPGAIALPMFGTGLWGPLSGYVALTPERTRVSGITFFAPKETPGLGAEITEPKFIVQWVGKSIVGADGRAQTIRVVKGKAQDLCSDDIDHCVDGVSGATITSRGVDAMVEQTLTWYDPYLRSKGGAP